MNFFKLCLRIFIDKALIVFFPHFLNPFNSILWNQSRKYFDLISDGSVFFINFFSIDTEEFQISVESVWNPQ